MRFVFLIFLFMHACVSTHPSPTEPVEPENPVEPELPPPADPRKVDCTMVSESIPLKYKYYDANKVLQQGTYNQVMPVTKPVAHEAHYLIEGLDPERVSSGTAGIQPHLERTCHAVLKGTWKAYFPGLSDNCGEVYKGGGATQWTPAEGGGIGHGSTGKLYPSLECEAATGNMYWNKSSPKPGTKFIASKDGKYFVLCMGYEAGPGNPVNAGGISTEALYYLGGKHRSIVTLGRALDQSIPYGPVTCK